MPFPTTKELTALAKVCHKYGISYLKSGDTEIGFSGALPADAPQKKRKNIANIGASIPNKTQDEDIESDLLTEDQLLYYSSGTGDAAEDQNQ